MEKLQEKLKKMALKLPDTPGVYKFIGPNKEIFYIGKATSLRSRVRSYFAHNIAEKRSELISRMILESRDLKFEKTDSVLEALILEAELIKKHLPPYNSVGKDQKSWNYVVITNEKFPRVLIVRGRELDPNLTPLAPLTPLNLSGEKFGPFTNSAQLREALKIIRKIFPFRDRCHLNQLQPCFNYQIGLCPGTCIGKVGEKEYGRTIRHITQFFQGKKKQLVKELEKEMKSLAKMQEFEKADEVKRKIFALKHIEDIALIKKDRPELQITPAEKPFRIEAYDVAHTSGTNIVGVMTVMESEAVKKSDYRMFKIRGQNKADDTKALQEILSRRFNHKEWPFPDLIVVDGGVAQLNAATLAIEHMRMVGRPTLKIPIVAVTKDRHHKAREILGIEKLKDLNIENKNIEELKKQIILANSESHRFAINFHRKKRDVLF